MIRPSILAAALLLAAAVLAAPGCGGGQAPQGDPAGRADRAAQPAEPSGPARQPATPGVGRKGQGYGTGPISTPIQAMWTTQQRLAFLQIAQPMNLYKAEHGHFPKSRQEFFEEIIKANGIELPELPAGQRYVYDAEKASEMGSYDPEDPPLRVEPEP